MNCRYPNIDDGAYDDLLIGTGSNTCADTMRFWAEPDLVSLEEGTDLRLINEAQVKDNVFSSSS